MTTKNAPASRRPPPRLDELRRHPVGHRLREQEALPARAAAEPQFVELILALDPFGDAGQVKAAAHVDEGVCQAGDFRVLACLLYTSPSPRDRQKSRMPSSA